jgi:hypothetical protein
MPVSFSFNGGGFAGAVGADKPKNLSFFNAEVQVIHRLELTVFFCQVFKFDHNMKF